MLMAPDPTYFRSAPALDRENLAAEVPPSYLMAGRLVPVVDIKDAARQLSTFCAAAGFSSWAERLAG
jgi:hypothetical protein